MGEDRLDQILRIVIDGPPFEKWDPTKAVRLWWAGKTRWVDASGYSAPRKRKDQSQSQEYMLAKHDYFMSDHILNMSDHFENTTFLASKKDTASPAIAEVTKGDKELIAKQTTRAPVWKPRRLDRPQCHLCHQEVGGKDIYASTLYSHLKN